MAHQINHYILHNDKVYTMYQGINYRQMLVDHMVQISVVIQQVF